MELKSDAEPPFWDDFLAQIPFCTELQNRYPQISDELLEFIRRDRPFMDYPRYGNLYSNTWEAFPLSAFEGEFISMANKVPGFDLDSFVRKARAQLPALSEFLTPHEEAGHLRNVFVSRLLPGSEIHPHRGWTSEFLRVHLGLVCDPLCTITIGSFKKTWNPGQLLSFKDGGPYLHSVSHRGTHERIILSLDLRLNYASQYIPAITA